ncbi:MAG: hypothetical protein MI867_28205 [Pseudomonadales bacterium]|nr:hypothetical protein [Pseudomonadales bacterium]
MQQTDWIFWLVAFGFYLPLHAGAPLLYLLIQGDIDRLKALKNKVIVHSVGSALVAFAIAIVAWPHSQLVAVASILLATVLPWLALRK